jgi:hypothetical protein
VKYFSNIRASIEGVAGCGSLYFWREVWLA